MQWDSVSYSFFLSYFIPCPDLGCNFLSSACLALVPCFGTRQLVLGSSAENAWVFRPKEFRQQTQVGVLVLIPYAFSLTARDAP